MKHIPVLQQEVIETLDPQTNQNFIDATLGFGGHAGLILEKTAPKGKLLGIEQDEVALSEAKKNLEKFGERFNYVKGNFKDLSLYVKEWKEEIHGILFDLGPSTYQLKSDKRGFSFLSNAPLDMRMDPRSQRLTARDIVNKFSLQSLIEIFRFGEEEKAKAIALAIVRERQKGPIETTFDLVEVVKRALPPSYRAKSKLHFATGTFRGLRMAVNEEIENLELALGQVNKILPQGAKIAVITFHSIEDRIVKNYFREHFEVITNKPITASVDEIEKNPSARSAKLRVAIKS